MKWNQASWSLISTQTYLISFGLELFFNQT